ncbi:MAG: hypothetical protein AAF399_04080 [Bacteroidota bacterium]
MKPFSFLLFLAGIMPSCLFAQVAAPEFHLWGIGLLHHTSATEHFSRDSLLPHLIGMPTYANAQGESTGVFEELDILEADLREYAYGTEGLIFLEEKNGYLRVLYRTTKGGLWLSREDLQQRGWEMEKWMDFFLHFSPTLFPRALGVNMNLRTMPFAHSKRLTTMTDDAFFIRLTGKTNGLWAEVEVQEWEGTYCEDQGKLQNEWTGWVKLLDDRGYPNLWFYTRGC